MGLEVYTKTGSGVTAVTATNVANAYSNLQRTSQTFSNMIAILAKSNKKSSVVIKITDDNVSQGAYTNIFFSA